MVQQKTMSPAPQKVTCTTAKFGGTSLADAKRIRQAIKIIKSDSTRRCVVVSAPGRRHSEDEKVTDMFAAWATAQGKEDKALFFEKIQTRIEAIVTGLKLNLDVDELFKTIERDAARLKKHPKDLHNFALSRGEWLSAQIIAAATGFEFVDAEEFIYFSNRGEFDMAETEIRAHKLGLKKKLKKGIVIPGFYGKNERGAIHTFPRGGSDITGSIAAALTESEVYENWTDVLGIRMADPRIVKKPKKISVMTYRELRELSFMGANVFHEDAIAPVRPAGIPIHVRSAQAPKRVGTWIVPEVSKPRHRIIGITGRSGYSIVTLLKDGMNSEVGFLWRAAGVFKKYGISVDHCPGTVDSLSFVVDTVDLDEKREQVSTELARVCSPDSLRVSDDITLIYTVGLGIARVPGMAGTICSAVGKAGIGILILNQGGSEISIVLGVREADGPAAIRAIYDSCVRSPVRPAKSV